MTDSAAPLDMDPPQPRPAQEPRPRQFRTARVVGALILREVGTRDSRTSLGFLWSIIDPIATVAILSIAFSLFTRQPRLGTNFPLYYVTGVVVYHVYSQISKSVSSSIRFSRQLLGFPSVTVLDAMVARFLLNFMIHVITFIALSYGVIHYYGLRVNIDLGPVILSLCMAAFIGLGIGAFNSVLFLMVPTYEYLWGMFTRPMAIASGVLVLIDDLPEWLFHILWWNPVAHIVAEMRHGFYPFYDTRWVSPSYVLFVSLVALVFGLVNLQRRIFDVLDQ